MKSGFHAVPEDTETVVAMLPHGAAPEHRKPGTTGTGALAFLASSSAEAMIARCPGVAALLPKMTAALQRQNATSAGILFDLLALPAEERALVGEVLGEGEVAAVVALPEAVTAQVQESVMAGLWRVRFTDAAGALLADYAEVSAIPQVIRRAAGMTLPALEIGTPPPGCMNVLPVLAEIRGRVARRQPGNETHALSLSLLPMNAEDIAFLQDQLGNGPVRITSRGYGTCRVQATAIHDVWSVQFLNTMDTLLLDTIEIGEVPIVACAAEEDFRDSAVRLHEIEEAYFR